MVINQEEVVLHPAVNVVSINGYSYLTCVHRKCELLIVKCVLGKLLRQGWMDQETDLLSVTVLTNDNNICKDVFFQMDELPNLSFSTPESNIQIIAQTHQWSHMVSFVWFQ